MNSKKDYKDVDKFFKAPLTSNQKAWMLIHEFYHIVLSYMKEKGISKADLARKLGKSRASVSQMFNKTPNLTIKKMVEIADAIGIDIKVYTDDLEEYKRKFVVKKVFIRMISKANWQIINYTSEKSRYNNIEIITDSSLNEINYKGIMPC